jgi:hypothetical protein
MFFRALRSTLKDDTASAMTRELAHFRGILSLTGGAARASLVFMKRYPRLFRSSSLAFVAVAGCAAADLAAYPEYLRPDPFGAIVEPDARTGSAAMHRIAAETPRGAYISFHLSASVPESGEYRLSLKPFPAGSGIQQDLFREWFHYVPAKSRYYPDALIPVPPAYTSRLPEPDNRIPKQTVQAFWLDVWVPASTPAGSYAAAASLEAAGRTVSLPIEVRVLPATVPAEDAVIVDHNSYGSSWLAADYPTLAKRAGSGFFTSDDFFRLLQAHHRIFYEHRGIFHQLGYGHAGKVAPEFAPRLEGSGKAKSVADWTLFDRHYGPLLDGSAFTQTRRGPKPIPFTYLPINPEWPATMLSWGEPGYEAEFVRVVSQMEQHFRKSGWTSTDFELFFNHKKRYKGFPWDGDETRFTRDYTYFRDYARLMKQAVPADSPVKFVFRADVSWTMERQFKELVGVINMWVCGAGMFGWYDYAADLLKKRGDIVWIYGGTPPVTRVPSEITVDLLRTWLWGVDGFVRWLTTSPGEDPWFHFQGGAEALVYPGDRFGVEEPIPSIRLKVERNAMQDLNLLHSFASTHDIAALRTEAAKRFNATTLADWRSPRPALADTNPEDWSNATIDDAMAKNAKFDRGVDAMSWQRVRDYTLQLAREVR